MTTDTHNIVIIGGNFAGVRTAHVLLRRVLPDLAKSTGTKYTVTLVAPSRKFFMTVTSPRALVDETTINHENMQLDILKYFEDYKKEGGNGLHFVQGWVKTLDPVTKTLEVVPVTDDESSESKPTEKISYDSVIVASGAVTSSPAFKPSPKHSHVAMKNHLRELAQKIKDAKTIAIGGAGSTGIEVACEIAGAYPDKKVTMFAGKSGVMPNIPKPQSDQITNRLKKSFGIELHLERVESAEQASAIGKYSLSVSGSSTPAEFDLYIPTVGQTPNTQFLPAEFVDAKGYVTCDRHMRIKGHPRHYAIGDVASVSLGNLDSLRTQTGALKETLLKELPALAEKLPLAESDFKYQSAEPKRPEQSFVIAMGRTGGVGKIMGYRFPSFLIKMLKAKDLGLGAAEINVGLPKSIEWLYVAQEKK